MSSSGSTDALVALYVLAHYPDEPPPVQALDSQFFAGLREFVEMVQEKPELLPETASNAREILDLVELRSNKLEQRAHQIKNGNDQRPLKAIEPGEFVGYVVPSLVPEQVQERKSLVELNLLTKQEPISRLLSGAHKTLRTEHYKLSLIEGKLGIIFNRIEELKNNDRWSLRQREPFRPPPRPKIHSEYMVEEMQWMRQCFKEERKFKIAMDYMLARAAADAGRRGLRPIGAQQSAPRAGVASLLPRDKQTLSLVGSKFDEFSKLLLGELRCFEFNPETQHQDGLQFVPVSKFLMVPESFEWQSVVLEKPREIPRVLVPSESAQETRSERFFSASSMDVRAPKPPDARYLNYRQVSIWLPEDDQHLLELVKQVGYNWELVSSYLMAGLSYKSDIERRTAWQCFERWLQLNPDFDVKDLKGRYAEAARIWLDSSSKAQAAVKRRISPVGVSADNLQRGHKRLRWSSMFDAMRKVKRKRETAPKNVRRSDVTASSAGSSSSTSSRAPPTAAELSRMKAERDRAVAEAYAQEQRQGRTPRRRPANVPATLTGPGGPGPVPGGPTAPPPVPQIAGLPVPSSVAAAASQYTPEQLQQMLERRRNLQRQAQAQAPSHSQAQSAQPTQPTQPAAAAAPAASSSTSGTSTPYYSPQAARQPPFSREQITNLMHTIAQKFPTLTSEQVQQRATQELNLYIHRRQQAAQAAQAQAQTQGMSSPQFRR